MHEIEDTSTRKVGGGIKYAPPTIDSVEDDGKEAICTGVANDC